VTYVDWLALGFVVLLAVSGARKGLLVGGLSLVGVVAGLYLGGRLAPLFFSGSRSTYAPLVALAGALVMAIALETAGALAGGILRESLKLTPIRFLDAAGGLMLGAATAVAVLWLAAVVALHIPQASGLKSAARGSVVLQQLVATLPPDRIMSAIASVDPFPFVSGPAAPAKPPGASLLRGSGIRAAEPSVVRVISEACGIGYAGSGWVVKPNMVVTAAHVVAGGRQIRVQTSGGQPLGARVVAFDGRNDLALLSVNGLDVKPLQLAKPNSGDAGAVLGYPGDGPFDAETARVGPSDTIFAPDYARHFVRRLVTSLRGNVRRGNSGGPLVNRAGAVELTVFGARKGTDVGYGASSELVTVLLEHVEQNGVSTGRCLE
jgi:S1-C subfamily serine protease